MDLAKSVNLDGLADTQFCITWPCFKEPGQEEKDDDEDNPGKKDRKKKRKKKRKSPSPTPCSMCRLGPAGAARSSVRRAALWCCTRCCLMCCSALRVLVAVVGVVGICLAAFYILSPSENKESGARVMRASLRALGARPRGAPRARPRAPPAGPLGGQRDRGTVTTGLDPFQPGTTTECGPDCPGGKTGCPGGRPDCPGGGPDGADCGPGCSGSRAACLGRNKDGLAGSPDIEVVAGPFQVIDSSVIVSPHDTAPLDEPVEDLSDAASPDDQGSPDSGSSPGDLQGQSGSNVPNDPED